MLRQSVTLSLLLAATITAAAHAGPPWISIEYPANPHHASTRGAAFLVRAYHHSQSINVPLRGVAEGIVDGKRTSHQLDITATNLPGVYAVRTPLPKQGTWLLALTLTEGKDAHATALVSVDRSGRIVAVDVPSDQSRDGWVIPRAVTEQEIESRLRAQVALEQSNDNRLFAFATLPLLLLGVFASRRTRR